MKPSKTANIGPVTGSEITPFSTPKQRFQSHPERISGHQDLIDEPGFDIGADAALVQFVTDLTDTITEGNSAMNAGFQIKGAVNFLNKFKTLAEKPKPTQPQSDPHALKPTEALRRA